MFHNMLHLIIEAIKKYILNSFNRINTNLRENFKHFDCNYLNSLLNSLFCQFIFWYQRPQLKSYPIDSIPLRSLKQRTKLNNSESLDSLKIPEFTFFPKSFFSHPICRCGRWNRMRSMSGFRSWTCAGPFDFRILKFWIIF